MRALSIILFVLTVAPLSEAQRYEISGFVGYGSGGEMKLSDTQLTDDEYVDIDMARSSSFGLALTMDDAILDRWELELLFLHHATQFEEKDQLFSEEPSGDFPPGEIDSLDINRTVLASSVVWRTRDLSPQQRQQGSFEPFFTAGFGMTYYSENTPLPSTWAPTLLGGVGTRFYVSDRASFRIEARAFAAAPVGERSETIQRDIRDCPGECIRVYSWPDVVVQTDINFGFSWKFDKFPRLSDYIKPKKF